MVPNSVDVVLVLFGEAWRPMGTLLGIFSLAIGPQVITSANGALLRAVGKTRLLFRLGLVNSVLLIASISIASFWSMEAIAWTFVAHSVVAIPLTLTPVIRRMEFCGRKLLHELARASILPILLFVTLAAARRYGPSEGWTMPAIQASLSALAVLLAGVLTRRRHQQFASGRRSADLGG
jgi:PST family polysaccharide transporter